MDMGEIRNQVFKVSRLVTPEGYSLTVETALKIVDRVMGNGRLFSDSRKYGSDLVLEVEGVVRTDDEAFLGLGWVVLRLAVGAWDAVIWYSP